MFMICLDLEGILTPEVWINVALKTGIDELKLTTRDISDYDVLMKRRLEILRKNKIPLKDIQDVISKMDLLDGAREFLDWLRSVAQVIILTDSFIEFAMPLMKKLGFPAVLCHDLETNNDGMIADYKLRIKNMKLNSVQAFKNMKYETIAVGDSYNDIEMLKEAKHGILFRPPENVIKEFPQFPVVKEYKELKKLMSQYLGLINS